MRKISRHFLKESEAKKIINDFCKIINAKPEELFRSKPKVELLETDQAEFFIFDKIPFSVKTQEAFFPTLLFREALRFLPKVIIDMGAVPHVCNGADIMAPGVVRIDGRFNEGDLILIVDEKHEKPLAIGLSLFDSEVMKITRRGKIVKNLHYVGDKIWNFIKGFA